MARFKFRLQTVLEHKQRLEELAQIEHANSQAALAREEAALEGLRQAEQLAVARLEDQRFTGTLDIAALQLGMGYLDALKVQIQRQSQVVERLRRQTEERREQLVARMQERKALERLRQQQLDAFEREQARIEAAEMDEMVVMRHGRLQLQAQALERQALARRALAAERPYAV